MEAVPNDVWPVLSSIGSYPTAFLVVTLGDWVYTFTCWCLNYALVVRGDSVVLTLLLTSKLNTKGRVFYEYTFEHVL